MLSGLAVHAGLLGLVGRGVFRYGAAAFGWGLDVVPLGLAAAGASLIAGRHRRGALGAVGSLALTTICSAGLADLWSGLPRLDAPASRLGGSGGAVGAGVGGGLHALVGSAGATILLLAVAFVAACGTTGLPVRAALGGIGRALRAAAVVSWHLAVPRAPAEPGTAVGAGDAAWPAGGPWSIGREGRAASAGALGTPGVPTGESYDGARAKASTSAPGGTRGGGDALAGLPVAGAGHSDAEPAGEEAGAEDLSAAGDVVELTGAVAADEGSAAQLPGHSTAGAGEAEGAGARPGAGVAARSGPAGGGEQLGLGIVRPPGPWKLPAARLLRRGEQRGLDRVAVEERGRVLERALASHGVETHLVGFTVGPTVTRFELELGAGVKVARVTSLARDIAYAMASPDVRILAPIPGRSAIGVEVPNVDRQLVTLGDVLASPEARRAGHPLEVALGRDVAGRAVMANLAEMPHLLIAGATGAGKSSCINSIITSLLMRSTPDEVRLILVDPKRVELGHYNGLPHLLTQVVVNPKRAANALRWAVTEMERRYDLLAEVGMRDITGYNAAVDRGDFSAGPFDPGFALGSRAGAVPGTAMAAVSGAGLALGGAAPGAAAGGAAAQEGADAAPLEEAAGAGEAGEQGASAEGFSEPSPVRFERLPYVVVVIDELNDLMMVAARDVEESICRIAQMARAVGIHLVIATQRPSVDVITGLIKANIPSRLAFSVSSIADSRVILDQPGAERLVGRGDLLLLTASSSVARRVQGPWVSEDEVRSVVAHWRRLSAPAYLEGVVGEDEPGERASGGGEDDDDLLHQAMELVVRSQLGSTSMLQRKLRVGFARAGRLMDLLERRGVVGPSEGSKARAVLMTPDELDEAG